MNQNREHRAMDHVPGSRMTMEKQVNSMGKTSTAVTRVISVTSGKGGVGKTTTTANIGMSVARLGYRVALIDADIGLRNLDLLLGLENRVIKLLLRPGPILSVSGAYQIVGTRLCRHQSMYVFLNLEGKAHPLTLN